MPFAILWLGECDLVVGSLKTLKLYSHLDISSTRTLRHTFPYGELRVVGSVLSELQSTGSNTVSQKPLLMVISPCLISYSSLLCLRFAEHSPLAVDLIINSVYI